MNREKEFEQLWKSHWKWEYGIIVKEIKSFDTFDLYTSDVKGMYYNYAVPTLTDSSKLDLGQVERESSKYVEDAPIYLLESHVNQRFEEHLVRNNYLSMGSDCWMIYRKGSEVSSGADVDIVETSVEQFPDFKIVLGEVFSDFAGNEAYLEICRKTQDGSMSSKNVPDLKSKMYVIYHDDEPVAGGALFLSESENIAYFHNAGTLPPARQKGYQTALFNHRVKVAKDHGIDRMYTIVEHGSQSWRNSIKSGFEMIQDARFFKLKS